MHNYRFMRQIMYFYSLYLLYLSFSNARIDYILNKKYLYKGGTTNGKRKKTL